MASPRFVLRSSRAFFAVSRPFSTTRPRLVDLNDRGHDTTEKHRKAQVEKPLNPHMTNTNSTIANDFPSVGKDKPPPEMITTVDPNFIPKDSVPENTERMTGGTQKGNPDEGVNSELDVGELEGASFKVEPLRRTGEDVNTIRARLLYQSRKRGTLESDLLLSTFADANLGTMSLKQLQQYDVFLDENDWDIYYWVTQEPTPTSMAYAEGAGSDLATPEAQGKDHNGKSPLDTAIFKRPPIQGEWAQTVGAFKPAYRPVPQRWKNSEILSLLRKHVKDRSAGGVHEQGALADAQESDQSSTGTRGGGLGMMPKIRNFDT